MDQIPDFWRTEVFHPLSVHFPIALLIVATVFIAISFFNRSEVWDKGGSILLALGSISAWISIYTGNLADGIVSRKLCDPTVLKDHENLAYYTAWFFSSAAVVDISRYVLSRRQHLLKVLVILSAAIGCYFLIKTGHYGATVVYQQAAGVYVPSSNCAEFE